MAAASHHLYQVIERGWIQEQQFGIRSPFAWLDRLEALVAGELAPIVRKIRTALRISTIETIAIGLELSRQHSTWRGSCVAPGGRRTDDVHSQGAGMANRGDARSNHVDGHGARIRGDTRVDAAVCLWISFSSYVGTAQARYGHARYTTLGEFARERVFNTIRRCNNGVRFDPLAPGCHLCSWYIVLPMSPGQTELEH